MAIEIPKDRLDIQYSRAGGPGGQHVNKVSTKAEVRFVVAEADWLPPVVRARLIKQLGSRLTNDGELLITSSRTRSQSDNLRDCLDKLTAMIATASVAPKKRKKTRPSRGAKERRLQGKREASQRKKNRSWKPGTD